MNPISSLIPAEAYLKSKEFKIAPPSATLFDLDMLIPYQTGRCPYPNCGNKLKIMRNSNMYCSSKKHPRLFIRKKK